MLTFNLKARSRRYDSADFYRQLPPVTAVYQTLTKSLAWMINIIGGPSTGIKADVLTRTSFSRLEEYRENIGRLLPENNRTHRDTTPNFSKLQTKYNIAVERFQAVGKFTAVGWIYLFVSIKYLDIQLTGTNSLLSLCPSDRRVGCGLNFWNTYPGRKERRREFVSSRSSRIASRGIISRRNFQPRK